MLEAPSFSPRPDGAVLREDAWIGALLVLSRHRVDHVVAGDAAAATYGRPVPPLSALTIVPAPYGRNLDRLADAVAEIGGLLDVVHRPAGTEGYRDLVADARPVALGGGLDVLVASSEDLDRIGAATVAA